MKRVTLMSVAGIIAFALCTSVAQAVPILLIDGGSEASADLYAAGTDIGGVTLSSDDINFFVEYKTVSGYLLQDLHVWMGDDIDEIPDDKSGDPTPGRFPASGNAGGASSYTLPVPFVDVGFDLNALVGEEIWYLAAHAVVETNSNSLTTSSENYTAWAGDIDVGNGKAFSVTLSAASIPEPSTILLLGTGLIGVVGLARRRKS